MKFDIVQLNELNFDLIRKYIDAGITLPNFERIIEGSHLTRSEEKYELLEPWIQWVSFYTGKSFSEHEVFRLGDFKNYKGPNILGLWKDHEIYCVSPMNLISKTKCNVFVPDPWTSEGFVGGTRVRWIYEAIKNFVNSNSSGKVKKLDYLKLSIGLLGTLSFSELLELAKFFKNNRAQKYHKAIFLDKILFSIYSSITKDKIDYRGLLFLNAGAHIQHHYLNNSNVLSDKSFKNPDWYIDSALDPFMEVLKEYDKVIGRLLSRGRNVLFVTGLSQAPHPTPKFYWRLDSHAGFLEKIGVQFKTVKPRMSRDFLIEFNHEAELNECIQVLQNIKDLNAHNVFGEFEITGKSLFVSLTYPGDINGETFVSGKTDIDMSHYVSLVAIKNGEHQDTGFWYFEGSELQIDASKIKYIWDFYDWFKHIEKHDKITETT